MRKGLTLMEIIIYVGIITLVLGIFFAAMFQMLRAQERSRINLELLENADFVIKKLQWAANDFASVSVPAANQTGTQLTINQTGSSENPIVFTLSDGALMMSAAGAPAVAITNDRVEVTSAQFTRNVPVYGPESIRIAISISNTPGVGFSGYAASTTINTTLYSEH